MKRGLAIAFAVLWFSAVAACSRKPAAVGPAEARALDLLQRHAGIEFSRPPEFRSVKPDALKPILLKEMETLHRHVLAPDQAKDVSKKLADALVAAVLAKYALEDKAVYLLPQNVEAFAKAHGLDERKRQDLLDYVLVHELVHAYQDRHFDLTRRIEELRSMEDVLVMNAMIEGHAEFVARRVAEKTGIAESVQALAVRSVAGGSVQSGEEALKAGAQEMFHLAYVQGRAFFAHLHDKGGWEAVAGAFGERWPRDTSVILHPERFFEKSGGAQPDWDRTFGGAEAMLAGWKIAKGPVGEAILKTALSMYGFPQSKIDGALAGFAGGRMWTCSAKGKDLVITGIRFKDEAARLAFERMDEEGTQTLVKNKVYTDVSEKEFEVAPGLKAKETRSTLSMFGQKIRTLSYNCGKGPLSISVTTMNEKAAGDLPKGVFEKIAERLAER